MFIYLLFATLLINSLIVSGLLINPSSCCSPVKKEWSKAFNFIKRSVGAVTFASIFLSNANFVVAEDKLRNLSEEQLLSIVKDDLTLRQALNTADFTRSIYSENCRFQDEIDIYPINDYVKGTKALFDEKASHTDLIEPITIERMNDEQNHYKIKLKFKETLAFNLPLIHPKVDLSGRLELTLDADKLIEYSREYWDQSTPEILKTIHL